jgi:hypothetical protein
MTHDPDPGQEESRTIIHDLWLSKTFWLQKFCFPFYFYSTSRRLPEHKATVVPQVQICHFRLLHFMGLQVSAKWEVLLLYPWR